MSLIIKGMEMPLIKTELIIFPSGHVQIYDSHESYLGEARAFPLPEKHGRLIDADRLLRDNPELADCDFIHPKYDTTLRELIDDAPTIIEAEGGPPC